MDGDDLVAQRPAGYPFRWRYSTLRALHHFRRVSDLDGRAPDPRLEEAVESVRARRQLGGTWLQEVHHPGREWFAEDVPPGQPPGSRCMPCGCCAGGTGQTRGGSPAEVSSAGGAADGEPAARGEGAAGAG